MRRFACVSALVLSALLPATATGRGQGEKPKPAVPVEAVGGILDAFRDHQIVALSDAHGNAQAHAFLLSLIRSERFAATVDDLVVEFGSARYQDVMDRFVRGDDVPYSTLRRVWQDTTQPGAANDLPHAEEVFRAVREVNAKLPRERQLRVLLGDPPIDWDQIRSRDEHWKWIEQRDAYPAALIQVEVIAKQRRALVVYGHGHFQRRNVSSNFDMSDWRAQTIVSLLERSGPTKVFAIWRDANLAQLQESVAAWKTPSVAIVRGTVLGAADASNFFSGGGRFGVKDGKLVTLPKSEWIQLRAEQQLDAVLYLGPPSAMTNTTWSPALCADAAYMKMRLGRIALVGGPPIIAEQLQSFCASVGK